MENTSTTFTRIAPGVYDSADGRWTMYRIEGVNPPAWNVEATVGAEEESGPCMVVDGAATMRDAVAIFAAEMASRV